MVKIIMGLKGSGKTKKLIDSINETVVQTNGSVVCIEKGDALKFDVSYRCRLIDAGEYHNNTCEVSMPLNGDALVWVAPADCSARVPTEKIEVFYVPQGTLLNIRPGVWHHAAFALDEKPLDVMIVLPERAYINDCVCLSIPEAEQIAIEI